MRTRVSLCVMSILSLVLFAATVSCSKAPTDAQVSSDVQTKFSNDSGLQGKQLAVQADKGTITLTGVVDNQAEKDAAGRYATGTSGVKNLVNNIQVQGDMAQAPADQSMQAQNTTAPPPAMQAAPASKPSPSVHHRASAPDNSAAMTAENTAPSSSASASDNQQAANQAAPSAQSTPPTPGPAAVAPPPPQPPQTATIASGTTLSVRLVDEINTKTAQQGQAFRATIDSPISVNGQVAVHAGYDVDGHIVAVQSAGQYKGQSMVTLQLDRLTVGDKHYSLDTDQFHREGASRSKNTAEKVGGGAAIGAILGGIFGGGKGAAIGAGAGSAAGGGVQAASKKSDVVLPSETVLTFKLQSPLTVTVSNQGPNSGRPQLGTSNNQ